MAGILLHGGFRGFNRLVKSFTLVFEGEIRVVLICKIPSVSGVHLVNVNNGIGVVFHTHIAGAVVWLLARNKCK